MTSIDAMLKGDCGLKKSLKQSLKSVHHLQKLLGEMDSGLGMESWEYHTTDLHWKDQDADPICYWWRNILEVAKWLLRQPAYRSHLVYSPKRYYDSTGRRIYKEFNIGDWWWNEQVEPSLSVETASRS